MQNKSQIINALMTLDPKADEHWTSDDIPRVDVVNSLMEGPDVTRAEISAAAPGFCRSNTVIEIKEESSEEAPSSEDQNTTPSPQEQTVQPESPPAEKEAPQVQENPLDTGLPGSVANVDQSEDSFDADDFEKEKAIAQEELNRATDALNMAKKRYKLAEERMDMFLEIEDERRNHSSFAHQVQAYQKSQAAQRAGVAQTRQFIQNAANVMNKNKV